MSEYFKLKVSKPTVLLSDLNPISPSCHERALWSTSNSFPHSLLTAQQLFCCVALSKQPSPLIRNKEEGGRIFSTKIHFSPWILCTRAGSQWCASWAWVVPCDWCHPEGWFRPPAITVSLPRSLSFSIVYRGSHQQPGFWSRWLNGCRKPGELKCSLRVTK